MDRYFKFEESDDDGFYSDHDGTVFRILDVRNGWWFYIKNDMTIGKVVSHSKCLYECDKDGNPL